LRGPDYDSFVEEFVRAVKNVFLAHCCNGRTSRKPNAFRLLGRYAGRLPSFNDDIQAPPRHPGRVLSGLCITGQPLREQRFLLVGSGAAGVGIGRLLRTALLAEGLTEAEARQRQIFMDSSGLVWEGRSDLEDHKREVALRKDELAAVGLSSPPPDTLEKIILAVHPTVLIGTTGQPGDFTPAAIRAMADHCERPIIFPLSNPTSKASAPPPKPCSTRMAAPWSPRIALRPVRFQGRKHVIGQCNNAFVFSGRRPGVLISEASRVTDSMFLAARVPWRNSSAPIPPATIASIRACVNSAPPAD